jgi:hypothetical protein
MFNYVESMSEIVSHAPPAVALSGVEADGSQDD